MTECTTERIAFSRHGRRSVQARLDGGRLITDSGVLLLREVDRRIGLTTSLSDCVMDSRDPSKVQHDQRTMLVQRIFGIACGYEDGNDHLQLRRDAAIQIATDQPVDEAQALASPATLSRMENRATRSDCVRMHEVLVDLFIASYDTPPKRIILDFDATDDRLHGQQEGRFFHGYYRHYCYLPLYVFCDGRLLVAYLRRSDIDAAKHSRAVLKLLVDKLRARWGDQTEIVIRGDGGFCRWRLMRWCDRHGVQYILGLARNKRLEAMSESLAQDAQAMYERTQTKQRHFHELDYAAGKWDRERRVIVKAEHLPEGRNLRYIVTNLEGEAQQLYDDVYCQRGEMENRIKEQQLDLFADRTSCSTMRANQFRLLLSSAAYVLVETLRRIGLKGTELAQAQSGTIRTKLLKIAARVSVSARRIVVHLSSGHPSGDLFDLIARQLRLTPE